MRTPSRHRPFAAILPVWLGAIVMLLGSGAASAQVLDKQKLLDAQTFWDNRDWDWYKANIPSFDSPDAELLPLGRRAGDRARRAPRRR